MFFFTYLKYCLDFRSVTQIFCTLQFIYLAMGKKHNSKNQFWVNVLLRGTRESKQMADNSDPALHCALVAAGKSCDSHVLNISTHLYKKMRTCR